MTDLKLIGIGRISPRIENLASAELDVLLNQAPDEFHRAAAANTGVNLYSIQDFVTIRVKVGNLKNNVLALREMIDQINDKAEELRRVHKYATDSLAEEAKELDFT